LTRWDVYIQKYVYFAGDKTKNLIGISETLVATSIAGVLFALVAGQPLVVVGATGPLLLFDESLVAVSFDVAKVTPHQVERTTYDVTQPIRVQRGK
jgi:hypothetical protein